MKRLIAWFLEEVRLMRAHSWEGEDMAAPAPERAGPPAPCTAGDPACKRLIERQAEARERMRRMKSGLLDAPDRKFTDSASTDVRVTMNRARMVGFGPVRAVARRAAR